MRVLLPGAGAETARPGSGPPPMPPEVGASRPSRSARNLPRSAAPCQGRGRVPCVGVTTDAASKSACPARQASRRSLRSSRDSPIGAGASFGSSRRRMLRRPVSEAGRFAGFRPRIAPSVDSPLLAVRRLPFVSRSPSPASARSRWAVSSRALLHRRVRCVVPPLPAGATRSSFHGLLSPSRSSSIRCTRSGAWLCSETTPGVLGGVPESLSWFDFATSGRFPLAREGRQVSLSGVESARCSSVRARRGGRSRSGGRGRGSARDLHGVLDVKERSEEQIGRAHV